MEVIGATKAETRVKVLKSLEIVGLNLYLPPFTSYALFTK